MAFFSSTKLSADDFYKVVDIIDNVEIRKYNNRIHASYIPINFKDRNNSFRNVASYIFGGNSKNQKIAMTSPVVIKLHNSHEMAFIMPKKHVITDLPIPNNNKIQVYEEPESVKACIRYSGFSNKKIEEIKIKELKEKLKKYSIKHNNDFEVLVYNSPWKLINRRNEISVTIEYNRNKTEANMSKIYLGGGCFWCTEAIFENIKGIEKVTSGYSGGLKTNPTYEDVSNGLTKHAEVCEIIYDPNKIQLLSILEIFFLTHDPTTLNRQGNDIGEHYRSIILYLKDSEEEVITNYIFNINKAVFDNGIVTEVVKFKDFYKAENYHQNYYQQNKSQPYCKMIISPKLEKARKKLNKYYK